MMVDVDEQYHAMSYEEQPMLDPVAEDEFDVEIPEPPHLANPCPLKRALEKTMCESRQLLVHGCVNRMYLIHQTELFDVFKSLYSIMPGDEKKVAMRQCPYVNNCSVSVQSSTSIDTAVELLHSGLNPLTMVVTPDFKRDDIDSITLQFFQWLIRTSFTIRWQNQLLPHLQCASAFFPHLLLFRNATPFQLLDAGGYRYLNACVVQGLHTCSSVKSPTQRFKVIRGKLNTVFDTALKKRQGSEIPSYLDSVILTDIGCTSDDDMRMYAIAAADLVYSYRRHFRRVCFAIDSSSLIRHLRTQFG